MLIMKKNVKGGATENLGNAWDNSGEIVIP